MIPHRLQSASLLTASCDFPLNVPGPSPRVEVSPLDYSFSTPLSAFVSLFFSERAVCSSLSQLTTTLVQTSEFFVQGAERVRYPSLAYIVHCPHPIS